MLKKLKLRVFKRTLMLIHECLLTLIICFLTYQICFIIYYTYTERCNKPNKCLKLFCFMNGD